MPKTTQVTVGETATVLVPAVAFDQTAYVHSASGTIYIGDSTVTTSTGYKMDNGDKLTLGVGDHEALYAITASGTALAYVLYQTN